MSRQGRRVLVRSKRSADNEATAIYVREMVESLGKVFSGRAPLSLETSGEDKNAMEGHVIIPVSAVEDAQKGH